MESTISISQACFAFKKKNTPTKSSAKRNKNAGAQVTTALYFGNAENENVEYDEIRYALYKTQWSLLENEIKHVQNEVHSQLLRDVIGFVQKQRTNSKLSERNEIPTVALVTGVNIPDHDVIFTSFTNSLREKVSSHLAHVKPKDGAKIKTLIQRVVLQIIHGGSACLETEDSDEDNSGGPIKLSNCTLPALAAWYENTNTKQALSPKKRRKYSSCSSADSKPLIIVIEDVESFGSTVLQDFVLICSEYLSVLPWIFVFGVPTSVASLHRLLPQSVSRCLSIEKFQAPLPSRYLSQVTDKILLSDKFAFKLGYKIFRLLEEMFLYHDFSVRNFTKGLKCCMLEHFYSNPVSLLCCSPSDLPSRINKLDSQQLEMFRQLPSFMGYVESCPAKEQTQLLLSNDFLKQCMSAKLSELNCFHSIFFYVILCLHSLVCTLPSYPLGKLVREVYGTCLEKAVVDTPEYEEATKLLRMLSREELTLRIKQCLEHLEDAKDTNLHKITARLSDYASALGDTNSVCRSPSKSRSHVSAKVELSATKKCDRSEYLQKLLQFASKRKAPNAYEVLRTEIIDYFTSTFRRHLIPPTSLPFHEVYYFDDISAVKPHLIAAPRSSIQLALSNPENYLQCKCCEIEDLNTVLPSMPDTCIAYKLHLESGRLINLYDWLQAFSTVADPDRITDSDGEKTDSIMQARFTRAVSELQFLGFVAPTRRKTDHVARLTWGGC